MSRPTMRFVGIKTQAQQDILMLHRIRENRVKQRTALVNQIRGLLGEYGIVLTVGIDNLRQGLCRLLGAEDERLSAVAREQFYALYEELLHQNDRVTQSDKALKAVFDQSEASQRLASLPGIGMITATALVAFIGDVSQFKNGRELSAYLGLVPRQHSSGGKTVLSGISKRGNTYLRTLLIHGARSVLRHLAGKEDGHSQWLAGVVDRRGHNKACVAQANKTARRVWALLTQETQYQLAA
ncbi:MAG: IS110 family transposase [Pseudomonadales bacterium]|nr:IS110 family transposase [Pseudomonadales bacterium]